MTRWEYTQLRVDLKGFWGVNLPDGYIDELNRLGDQGWELVELIPLDYGVQGTVSVVCLLKRPVAE